MMNKRKDPESIEQRRKFLEDKTKVGLPGIGNYSLGYDNAQGRNCDNMIGVTQVPLGVVGPLKINEREYFVPLSTTEGVLIASVNRGAKAITLSGGAIVLVEKVGVNRGPVFKVSGIREGRKLPVWLKKHFPEIQKVAQKTSSHLKLIDTTSRMAGRNVWVKFDFETGEAMGMNMVTTATEAICRMIEDKTGIRCVSVAGNFEIDKKAGWLNFYEGRGRKVWAEVKINKREINKVFKTTVDDMVEVYRTKVLLGSVMAGSEGFNAQAANVVAAFYLATGQDMAHVVEGSQTLTTIEKTDSGDLYASVHMPAVLVGTVGGGTALPTQREAISILGHGSADDLAEVLGASVLAGELSLIASLAEGTLGVVHQKAKRLQ